jgi:hypothetical protein
MRYYFGRTHWLDAISPPLEKHIATLRDAILVNLGRELKPEPAPVQRPPEEQAKPAEPPATATPPKRREAKAVAPKAPTAGPAGAKKLLQLGIGALVVVALVVGGVLFWPRGAEPSEASTTSAAPSGESSTSSPQTSGAQTIVVTSAEDGGPGTLREALLVAEVGAIITFDAAAFPPESPVTIMLKSGLPPPNWGTTLDASNAGVILDGSQAGGDWTPGMEINSPGNVVKGLQIVNFSGPGILLGSEARTAVVGGDRRIGRGPLGEGNLLGHNKHGILLAGDGNSISGNLIGTDTTGSADMGNRGAGIVADGTPSNNTIGPDNIIAYSGDGPEGDRAIHLRTLACANTITANSIRENSASGPDIFYEMDPAAQCAPLPPPAIHDSDLESGVVSGQTCAGCRVEIFSTQTEDGEIYEGSVTATEYGNFTFEKGAALAGPFLTATVSSPGENTSEFSQPTRSRSAIGMALDLLQTRAPIYQTDFSSWEFGDPEGDAKIEDGTLILSAAQGQHTGTFLSDHPANHYAIEFDFRLVSGAEDGHCIYEAQSRWDGPDPGSARRALSAEFAVGGGTRVSQFYDPIDDHRGLASAVYDTSRTHTVRWIVLGDQIAAFINGRPLYAIKDPLGSAVYSKHGLAASDNVVCEFDNFRLWSLEE